MLTRTEGNAGSRWHCHRLHQPDQDDAGPTQTVPPLPVALNLCYPEGFTSGDGALKLVRAARRHGVAIPLLEIVGHQHALT